MWEVIIALTISAAPPLAPPDHTLIPQAPYVSCRDGHIAPTLDQCPVDQPHKPHDPNVAVGGGGRSGLLGLGIGGIL
jgi:hypothetical protein